MPEKFKKLKQKLAESEKCSTFATHFSERSRSAHILHLRGVAQLVSAPALGAGGPKFESWYPDLYFKFLSARLFLLCRCFFYLTAIKKTRCVAMIINIAPRVGAKKKRTSKRCARVVLFE
jgi:hypothetical protein